MSSGSEGEVDLGLQHQSLEMALFRRNATGPSARIFAVGDIGLCGAPGRLNDVDPWVDVRSVMTHADAVFGNLETPFARTSADFPFVAPLDSFRVLSAGGFSILNLANNHILDAGREGLISTLDSLDQAHVETVGAGGNQASARRLVVTVLGGLKIGWLGCARTLQQQECDGPGFWELDEKELLAAVQRHREAVDALVVSIHMGYMYVDYPHPEHRQLTHRLVAAGASLVLVHHAHVVQGIEVVDERAAICHNLGNFLFDWRVGEITTDVMVEEQRRGIVVAIELDRKGLSSLKVFPTRVDDDWVVRMAVGETGEEILGRLTRISQDLRTDYAPEFRRQRAERNTSLAFRSFVHRLKKGEVSVVAETLPQLRWHHLAMVMRWLVGWIRRRRTINE